MPWCRVWIELDPNLPRTCLRRPSIHKATQARWEVGGWGGEPKDPQKDSQKDSEKDLQKDSQKKSRKDSQQENNKDWEDITLCMKMFKHDDEENGDDDDSAPIEMQTQTWWLR